MPRVSFLSRYYNRNLASSRVLGEGLCENNMLCLTHAPIVFIEIQILLYFSCNKQFKSDTDLEFHAVKSGHVNFEESTDDIRPLTEEEKQAQLRK